MIGDVKEAPEASKISIEITKASSATYIQSWEYPQSQGYVKVVLDTLKSATYLVQFNTTKELPEGYQVGTLSSDPSRVTVSGPTSAFSNLAAVKANVDLSAITDGGSVTAPLALYDGNNRTLSGSGLTISQSTVEVTVSLNQAKEISISIAGSSGTPADGYVVSKVDYSPKLLTISGSKNALANISNTLSRILGVENRTIQYWERKGLKSVRKKPYVMYRQQDIIRYMKEHPEDWNAARVTDDTLFMQYPWFKEKRKNDISHKYNWTQTEVSQMKMLRKQGFTIREIAEKMNRSESSIKYKLYGREKSNGRS